MNQEPKRQPPVSEGASLVSFTLRDLLLYFVHLGMLGFGGPIALAGHMQRDLVEGRRWVSKQDYLEGLAFSQLSPGPLAAQLAMYPFRAETEVGLPIRTRRRRAELQLLSLHFHLQVLCRLGR
jgi:Chromate transporter